MAAAHKSSALLQRLRRRRSAPALLLVLLAYFLTGAAVPPGHMAAPLGSGTAFHLCPGDLRSAHILTALADAAKAGTDAASDHGEHHRNAGQEKQAGHNGHHVKASPDSAAAPSGHHGHASHGDYGDHHGPTDAPADHREGAQSPAHHASKHQASKYQASKHDDAKHHGAGHHVGDGADAVSVDKSSAEPGCSFAGFGTIALSSNPDTGDADSATALFSPPRPVPPRQRSAWLRPPVRSPPIELT